jgi:hypothetical protein
MEISPVPEIRDFTAIKAPAADFQLSTVVDIDVVARPDHSARAAARKKAAGAEETDAEDAAPGDQSPEAGEDQLQPHISFFA